MEQRSKWAILSGVVLAMLLSSLDQTIVSTAMPTIVQELHGLEHISWVFTAYMLGSTVTVPIYGKLSDIFGRRNLYLLGIVIFLIGSVLCGLSQDMTQLILFRGIQGIGGGAMMVNSFAIIGDVFPPAELIERPQKFTPDFENEDMNFWGRTFHFEMRYWSIDDLLSDLNITNILELSAGYSFRGLDTVRRKEVHYIDTDLPQMTERKKELYKEIDDPTIEKKGQLEILPLNALDENQFNEVVSHFPPGEIVIVNEGLLLYLSAEEKEKLCRIIHKVLKERGGYWITADIYKKMGQLNLDTTFDEKTRKFFEEHNVEQNRFESMEAAETFFKENGFVIDKEAEVNYQALSTFPYVMKFATQERLQKFAAAGKVHATWRLKAV